MSVAAIALQVGMSRAPFAKRFSTFVGETPLAYLTRWRMDVAARQLRDTAERVYVIATHVGYDSETSFSKAFARAYGMAPGRCRVLHDCAAYVG